MRLKGFLVAVFGMALAGVSLVGAAPTSAQEESSGAEGADSNPIQLPAGTVDCFDYYRFGSAQADISPTLSSTVSGATLGFNGTLTNENEYPLVDASVFVKIYRRQTDDAAWHTNGHYLVDQFFAVEHVDLPAKGTKPLQFVWKVPSYALSGDYFATTYVATQKKFNFLGLSFTNDINGNIADFTVKAEQPSSVMIDPNTVTLNKSAVPLAQFPSRINKDEPATVEVSIKNGTKQPQSVPVKWTLYRWDGIGDGNQLDQQTEVVTLKAGETKKIPYTVTDTRFPVYYVTAESEYRDAKSLVTVRFVRDGIDRVRINFPGVTAYPLEAGKQVTLFSCLHNSGTGFAVENGKLDLTVTDTNGKVVDSYEYMGPVSGSMMGVKHDFTPKETLGAFTVNAKLYQDGDLVDEATMHYDCKSLGGKCPTSAAAGLLGRASQSQLLWILLLAAVAILLVARVARSDRKPRRGHKVQSMRK